MRGPCLLIVLVGCGRVAFDVDGDGSIRDAVAIDVAIAPPDGPAQLGPFTTVLEQTAINSAQREFGACISDDALELYFSTYRSPPNVGASDIWRATRVDRAAAFGNIAHIASIASTDNDGEPTLAHDGVTMYFQRYLPTTQLYVTSRPDVTSAAWATPVPVEMPQANLLGMEGADFGPDDLRLVVVETATLEFYELTRPDTSSPWGPPQLLTGLGGMAGDGFPALRGDGLEIFWESSRQPPQAIYRAERPSLSEPFGAAERVSLGAAVDVGDAGDPDISADGRVLVFVSNASAGVGGEYDIYVAEREPL